MTTYFLQIELQSPLTSSGGENRPGQVDKDVIFDGVGLPVLPGRRLKGLLREAYRDIADAYLQCGKTAPEADAIFGATGQRPGHGDARLRVDNGQLAEAEILLPWLAYLQSLKKNALSREEVMAAYASIRSQTAVDVRTGAPKENTLRLIRTLKSGLVFQVPLQLNGDAQLIQVLALSAAALKTMGTSRTRGPGKVSCSLMQTPVNLTDQFLNQVQALPDLSMAPRTPHRITDRIAPVASISKPAPTHFLRYRLTLQAPAAIPEMEGDPNTVTTRDYIPGSQIWGAAAAFYLNQSGRASHDPDFQMAFLDGALRFLPAYPESMDFEKQRLLPIPHSIREDKASDFLIDYLKVPDCKESVRRKIGFARMTSNSLEVQPVETQLSYHHQRAKNRAVGRALGAEVQDGGTLFVYESIQPNQCFQGVVLGTSDMLAQLQNWLKTGEVVKVGRSRSAQYGGEALFAWIGDAPEALETDKPEWSGFQDIESEDTDESDTELSITTLSHLLTVNESGHPAPEFPVSELQQALDITNLKLERSYTRTELIGGYASHLRLPRQQWPAIAPGSVFVFRLTGEIAPKALAVLEMDGLGLRREEGYGRIALNRQKSLKLTGREAEKIKPESLQRPAGACPDAVRALLTEVARARLQMNLQEQALEQAEKINKPPTASLLGRLGLIVRQNSLPNALAALNKLKDRAKNQLTECKLDVRWHKLSCSTLQDFLQSSLKNPDNYLDAEAKSIVSALLPHEDLSEVADQVASDAVQNPEPLVKQFLQVFLSELARKHRRSKPKGQRNE